MLASVRKGRAVIVLGDRNHYCEKRKQDVLIVDERTEVAASLGLGTGRRNSWWGISQRVTTMNYRILIAIGGVCWR